METTIYNQILPKGSVIMWYGEPDKLPDGWELCDGGGEGENKRPDLMDRFPVGAGGKYKKGDEPGGNDKITLNVNQMPRHSHIGTTNAGDGAHQHHYTNPKIGAFEVQSNTSPNNRTKEYPTDDGGITPEGEGTHQHRFTTDTAGEGNPIEITPPYVALYFIIKTKD